MCVRAEGIANKIHVYELRDCKIHLYELRDYKIHLYEDCSIVKRHMYERKNHKTKCVRAEGLRITEVMCAN